MTEEAKKFLKIKPAAGRIAVNVENKTGFTKSGLFLPDTVGQYDRPTVGRVREVCEPYAQDGVEYEALFSPGNIVVFGKYTGTQIEIGKDKVVIMRETDVLAVLYEDAEGTITEGDALNTKVTDFA